MGDMHVVVKRARIDFGKFEEDVIVEILARLPVRSLMRFRCVCKSWLALISDSHFVKKHLSYQERGITESPRMLIFKLDPLLALDCDAFKSTEDHEALESVNYDDLHGKFAVTPLDFPVKKTNPDFWCNFIVGSCNGLVCVEVGLLDIMPWNRDQRPTDPKALLLMNHCATDSIDSKAMILWNPCTRDFTVLPNPAVDSKFRDDFYGLGYDCVKRGYFYGLGYDSVNDDYKVVQGFIRYSDGAKEIMVYIFSLKAGSWRSTVTEFEYVGLSTRHGLFVNGALHWLPDRTGSSILSFDLGKEEFQKISLPYHAWFSDPFIHKNCLCVCARPAGTNTINIWMMKEYGVKESWTEVVQSSLENYVLGGADFKQYFSPVCILENGLVLINAAGVCEHLVVLSLRDKKFTHFVEVAENEGLETVIYRETLVSPDVHTYKFNNVS